MSASTASQAAFNVRYPPSITTTTVVALGSPSKGAGALCSTEHNPLQRINYAGTVVLTLLYINENIISVALDFCR